MNTEWCTIILPRQQVFSDKATVNAGATLNIVNEGVSGGQFLEVRSIQATPTDDVKLVLSVDKDTLLNVATKCLGETPEKALGVFIIADERKTLKVDLVNNGGGAATLNYLINALYKKRAPDQA